MAIARGDLASYSAKEVITRFANDPIGIGRERQRGIATKGSPGKLPCVNLAPTGPTGKRLSMNGQRCPWNAAGGHLGNHKMATWGLHPLCAYGRQQGYKCRAPEARGRDSQRGFPTGSSRFQYVPAGRSKCSRLSRFQQVPAGSAGPGRFSRYQQDPAVPSNAQQVSARCNKIQKNPAERGKRSTFQQVPTGPNLLRRFVDKICGEAKAKVMDFNSQ